MRKWKRKMKENLPGNGSLLSPVRRSGSGCRVLVRLASVQRLACFKVTVTQLSTRRS